jgi:hypothetical protein
MELKFAFLAEAAKVEESGIFSVIGGGFDVLRNAGPFPAKKRTMSLLGRLELTDAECRTQHELVVELIGPDGRTLPSEIRLRFIPFKEGEQVDPKTWITVGLDYRDVTFPDPGEYTFRVSVGPQALGDVRLQVVAEEKET